LTAAHCVIDEAGPRGIGVLETTQVNVTVGVHNRNEGGQKIEVAQWIIHNQSIINKTTIENDIAILKLKEKIQVGPNVAVIDWRDSPSARYEGKEATAIGWGRTENSKPYWKGSDVLMEVQMKVLPRSHEDCKISIPGDPDTKVCAEGAYVTGKTICQGDSGGPLFISQDGHYKLIGITSYGYNPKIGTCGSYLNSVYTKVNQYVDWIENQIGGSEPSPCVTCSRQEHCTLDGDNLIGRMTSIRSECSCLAHCSSYAGCAWYTWYDDDDDHPGSGHCYLFSSSVETETCWPCSHCYSGPPDCPTAGNTTNPNAGPLLPLYRGSGEMVSP